jgi:hypothetical protein
VILADGPGKEAHGPQLSDLQNFALDFFLIFRNTGAIRFQLP